jgi:hypothetical protein
MTWSPSIRNKVFLAVALLLPLTVPAIHPHRGTLPVVPAARLTGFSPATPDAEHTATVLVDAIIQIESNGDPRKVGRHGERGLMQIKAGTWRDMTTRLFGRPLPFDRAFDPALNRRVGTAYLAFLQEQLLARKTEWKSDERALLLAAYNAGPGRLRKCGFCMTGMPRQTRDYVARATALHDAFLKDMASAVRQRLLASRAGPAPGI